MYEGRYKKWKKDEDFEKWKELNLEWAGKRPPERDSSDPGGNGAKNDDAGSFADNADKACSASVRRTSSQWSRMLCTITTDAFASNLKTMNWEISDIFSMKPVAEFRTIDENSFDNIIKLMFPEKVSKSMIQAATSSF